MGRSTLSFIASCLFAVVASLQDAGVKPALQLPAPEQDATVVAPKNYKVELENDLVRVVRVTYDPHEKTPMHEHQGNAAVIVVLQGGGRMRQVNADGTIVDGKTERRGLCGSY
jgi:quercetin dioxygenase-like cupin family protein